MGHIGAIKGIGTMAFDENRDGGGNRLLTGWKQIAFYFGKDESTAKRWAAQRRLPIHRVPGQKRASVYAYSAELETWLRQQDDIQPEPAPAPALPQSVAIPPAMPERSAGLFGRFGAAALAIVVIVAITSIVALGWRDVAPSGVGTHAPKATAESLYLDGVFHLEQRTGDGLHRAIGLFTAAVAEDPAYARAYGGLADAYNLLSQYTDTPPDEAYPQARVAAERALALDPRDAGAYAALAFNSFYWKRDFKAAIELFEKSVTLDPDNARAHHWYALAAMHNRRFDLAEREIREAQRLDPRAPAILANKGLILFHAGKVDEALGILGPLAQSEPKLLSPHAYLATIYLSTGRTQDFLREYRTVADLSGSAPQHVIADAAASGLADGGESAMLNAMLAAQQVEYAADREPAFKLALTAAMLGDTTLALGYLQASYTRNEQDILGIRLEPALATLRDDATYRTLVAEVGFDND
jgi:tetratricopeptide (TPR) repeat protein